MDLFWNIFDCHIGYGVSNFYQKNEQKNEGHVSNKAQVKSFWDDMLFLLVGDLPPRHLHEFVI